MSTAKTLIGSEVIHLSVNKIAVNPYQPRKFFSRSNLEELAASIKEYGVIQPISVRYINNTSYELVAGERRLRASKLAGRETIPAIILNANDVDSAVIALLENMQRQDLNYFEEAEGMNNLMSDCGFTQEQLAERLGKKQSTVANKLRLLKLPREIQYKLLENGLTERHSRALLRLPDMEMQMLCIEKIIAHGLNVKKTEELIEKMLDEQINPVIKSKTNKFRMFIRDIKIFKNTVKEAVEIMNSSGIDTSYEIEEGTDGCFISIMVAYK